jgi:deoxyribodipyrimidine photo-lyase
MNKPQLVIYWSRRDFRLQDNPALYNAIVYSKNNNIEFLPIFIIDPGLVGEDRWNIGYPRRWFLSQALGKYSKEFEKFEIIVGQPTEVFEKLSHEFNVSVYVNSDIEPYARKRDAEVSKIITSNGGSIESYSDQLSVDKNVLTGSGNFYSVYSPFRKKVWDEFLDATVVPIAKPYEAKFYSDNQIFNSGISVRNQTAAEVTKAFFDIIDTKWLLYINDSFTLNLDEVLARPNLEEHWYTDEKSALSLFNEFNENKILKYKDNRDDLGLDAKDSGQTSHMSAALKWGLVSARTLKDVIITKHDPNGSNGVYHYISELVWREFYRYVLYQRPDLLNQEFQTKYQHSIEWRAGEDAQDWFVKWIKGETGYKVVDAAMHQIAQMGWMHNRSRMIVASILTKNLGIDWRWGQEYFRAILLDLDEASNNGGWQWAASVGADPKPIRIFNPYTQAENYDKNNLYQSKYLPKYYDCEPLIEHKQAREEALVRYKLAKESGVRDF